MIYNSFSLSWLYYTSLIQISSDIMAVKIFKTKLTLIKFTLPCWKSKIDPLLWPGCNKIESKQMVQEEWELYQKCIKRTKINTKAIRLGKVNYFRSASYNNKLHYPICPLNCVEQRAAETLLNMNINSGSLESTYKRKNSIEAYQHSLSEFDLMFMLKIHLNTWDTKWVGKIYWNSGCFNIFTVVIC